jgi:hypothetical protein
MCCVPILAFSQPFSLWALFPQQADDSFWQAYVPL